MKFFFTFLNLKKSTDWNYMWLSVVLKVFVWKQTCVFGYFNGCALKVDEERERGWRKVKSMDRIRIFLTWHLFLCSTEETQDQYSSQMYAGQPYGTESVDFTGELPNSARSNGMDGLDFCVVCLVEFVYIILSSFSQLQLAWCLKLEWLSFPSQ